MAAARRGAEERADRERAHHEGAGDRGKAPHHDEEEHAEEEDAHEGAERERERGVGDHRTTGPAMVLGVHGVHGAGRTTAHRRSGGGSDGHQRDRRLDDEHRPPVDELGDSTAEHGPERGTGHARGGPPAGGATGVAEEGDEHTERAGDERRATDSLHHAGGDEGGERGREPGRERRGGEHGGTARARASRR